MATHTPFATRSRSLARLVSGIDGQLPPGRRFGPRLAPLGLTSCLLFAVGSVTGSGCSGGKSGTGSLANDEGPDEKSDEGSSSEGEGGNEITGNPDLSDGEEGGDSGDDDDSADSEEGPDVDTPKFDLGTVPDAIKHDKSGCEKVDFLFVVDNSPSMADEQTNLVNSFPGFVQEIEDVVKVNDFHVMVIDTDAGRAGNSNCTANQCHCQSPDCCSLLCGGGGSGLESCNFADCESYPPGPCGQRFGGGLTARWDSGADCNFTSGGRYMDETQPDLTGAFECVARTGTGGSPWEAAMTSTLRSITDEQAPGACNEGFMRKDALLVITIITDEADTSTPGTPAQWAQTVTALKGGNEQAVVAISVVNRNTSRRIVQFAESFTNNRHVNITDPDFSAGFGDAVHVIDVACDDFDPEG